MKWEIKTRFTPIPPICRCPRPYRSIFAYVVYSLNAYICDDTFFPPRWTRLHGNGPIHFEMNRSVFETEWGIFQWIFFFALEFDQWEIQRFFLWIWSVANTRYQTFAFIGAPQKTVLSRATTSLVPWLKYKMFLVRRGERKHSQGFEIII